MSKRKRSTKQGKRRHVKKAIAVGLSAAIATAPLYSYAERCDAPAHCTPEPTHEHVGEGATSVSSVTITSLPPTSQFVTMGLGGSVQQHLLLGLNPNPGSMR